MWADEFLTSKLDVYGHPARHPRETRAEQMRPPACWAERHSMDAPGCRCFCAHHSGYAEKRTVSRWCAKSQFQYAVCCHNHGQKHGHRMWNRDVLGTHNIGCLFLAQSLELDPGLWKRGTVATTFTIVVGWDLLACWSCPAILALLSTATQWLVRAVWGGLLCFEKGAADAV